METPEERGRRLGRKYVLVVFGVLAGAFTLANTQQIIFGVFGLGSSALPPQGSGAVPASGCAEELRAMAAAVDRAVSASAQAADEDQATALYRAALAPEWGDSANAPPDIRARCAAEPHGQDALATVLRLRAAGEEVARRHAAELAPLRRDIAAYLRIP
jgi:hypothetical protein